MRKFTAVLLILLASSILLSAQDTVAISAQTAVLRGTPDAAGAKIAILKLSDSAELITTRGDWHLVQTSKYVGWVDTRAVTQDRGSSGPGKGGGMGTGKGSGWWTGGGQGTGTGEGKSPAITTPLRILSKPRPQRTEAARENKVQGTVILRVAFLASGQIGTISVVKALPHGLTEQAVAAARRIQFEPAMANGVPQTVTQVLEYSFVIY